MIDLLPRIFNLPTGHLYLDAITVFSEPFDAHLKDVNILQERLRKEGVSLNLKRAGYFSILKYTWNISLRPVLLLLTNHVWKGSVNFNTTEIYSLCGSFSAFTTCVGDLASISPTSTYIGDPIAKFLKKGCPNDLPALGDHESQIFGKLV